MKEFLHQAGILGGIYFIIKQVLSSLPYQSIYWIEILFALVLIVLLVFLMFKKNFSFINKIINGYPKISNYIAALGVAVYFGFFFGFVPGAIDGYFAARASFMHKVYVSQFVSYLPMFAVLYRVVFWVALLLATYLSFVKPWIYRDNRK